MLVALYVKAAGGYIEVYALFTRPSVTDMNVKTLAGIFLAEIFRSEFIQPFVI